VPPKERERERGREENRTEGMIQVGECWVYSPVLQERKGGRERGEIQSTLDSAMGNKNDEVIRTWITDPS
jgi:hypothetical protein